MTRNPSLRRPIGRQLATPPRVQPAVRVAPEAEPESSDDTPAAPDPVIAQAGRDIDAGLVDTDLRATPGLDAQLRDPLVPGPGRKAP